MRSEIWAHPMSQLAATQVSRPRDEQAFERACLVLWRCVLNDPNVQTNARRGQAQDGVDLFGFRNQDTARPVGIQCKLKGEGKQLSEKEVRDEAKMALTFEPALREYFIVTTAPDDGNLQRIARELTIEAANSGRSMMINVWGWQTLEQQINEHPDASNAFDPTYGPQAKKQDTLLLQIVERQESAHSQVIALSNQLSEVRATFTSANFPGDATEGTNALEAALDAEIDSYRDALNEGRPKTAMKLFDALLKRVANSASGRILFRIKANIGHAHLVMSDEARGAHWLSEAYHHAPTEPKAIANYALSLILQKRSKEAFEYGLRELRSDPKNGWVAGYVIHAAARCSEISDPIGEIPEPLRGLADVEAARIDFLRIRDEVPAWWIAARKAHAAHPDHKFLAQSAAEADLDEIGRSDEFRLNNRLSSDVRQRLQRAVVTLRARWDERQASENPRRPDGVAACCNLLGAYYALGDTAEALAIAKQAAAVVVDDEALLQRATIAALEGGDDDFAAKLIEKLPQSPEATLMRFQFYAHKGDLSRLVEIADLAYLAPAHERRTMQTMGRLATLMMNAANAERHAELDRILQFAAGDARSSILVSDFATKLKQTDIADKAYQQAISLIGAGSHRTNRSMVARTAGWREDWSTVTRLLDGYVETDQSSAELALLMTAFANESPVRQRAIEFFRELPDAVRSMSLCATAYAYVQSKRGDLTEAEKWFLKALDGDPASLTALLGLLRVHARQGDRRGAALMESRLKELNLAAVCGAPADKMALSHFLRDVGLYDKAVKLAYETARANRNDPEVALLYFGLFMFGQAGRMIPHATAVGVDTWVAIENNLKARIELLIEDGPDQPADNVYSPAHAFVAPALGLAVGEKFSQQKSFGPPETWQVLEIKHKSLHLLHEMQKFNVRFPDAKGLYYFAIEENDVAPILEQVKRLSDRTRKIADMYTEQHLPLAVVTGISGGETTGFAGYLRQHGHDIVACHGNHPERAAAERLARQPPTGGAVLDFYTAWIAASLKVIGPLKSLFGRLIVPRSVIDAIAQLQHDAGSHLGRESMSVGYHKGSFIRQVFTDVDAEAHLRMIEERRIELEGHCEVLPIDVPNDASESARAVAESCGAHVLDAAFLAASDNRLLLSDDLYFRQLADQACGAKRGIWLQPALNVAWRCGILKQGAYAKALVGLAVCRHTHIALDGPALDAVLQIDDTDRLMKFTAVADFIGTRSAEIHSHVAVVIKFLIFVWALDIPDLSRAAASGIVLEKLFRHRQSDWRAIVAVLRKQTAIGCRAAEYLESWLRGHFLTK